MSSSGEPATFSGKLSLRMRSSPRTQSRKESNRPPLPSLKPAQDKASVLLGRFQYVASQKEKMPCSPVKCSNGALTHGKQEADSRTNQLEGITAQPCQSDPDETAVKRVSQDLRQSEDVDDTSDNDGSVEPEQSVEGQQEAGVQPAKRRTSVQLEFSDEVKLLSKDLYAQAQSATPPTVAKFKMFTTDALEALLGLNARPTYGLPKQELATMVRDYMMHGCPPRCPKCQRGQLKFSNGKKRYGKRYYWCPGSTRDGKHFFGCNYRAPRQDILWVPWMCPD